MPDLPCYGAQVVVAPWIPSRTCTAWVGTAPIPASDKAWRTRLVNAVVVQVTTHEYPNVTAWLARNARIILHFT